MNKDKRIFVSIIVLNWNGKTDTLECLTSIQNISYSNFNIIVADNGSTDDSVATIRSNFPNVLIFENGANLGFAEGNNRAIFFALEHGSEAILLLNNDTIVDPDILSAFVKAYEDLPNAGILGATSYYYDQPDIICAAGAYWDASIREQRFICQGFHTLQLPSKDPYEVDFVVGCALFVGKEVINTVGLMDPRFFLNYEENDWCQRARKKSFINYSVPGAKIWHKVGASFGGQSPLWIYFMTRNELIWSKRYLSRQDYQYVLKRSLRSCFPVFSTQRDHGLRAWYWALRVWLKQLYQRRDDPRFLAVFYGIAHFFLRIDGDCPAGLRARLVSGTSSFVQADCN